MSLHLNGNQLASLPTELGSLAALTYLNLRGYQLTSLDASLPAELGAFTALKRLFLAGNRSACESTGGVGGGCRFAEKRMRDYQIRSRMYKYSPIHL